MEVLKIYSVKTCFLMDINPADDQSNAEIKMSLKSTVAQ